MEFEQHATLYYSPVMKCPVSLECEEASASKFDR